MCGTLIRNIIKILIIIIYIIIILYIILNGSITLNSIEIKEGRQTHESNYTYHIETYLPVNYLIICQKYPCNYTLSGNSLFGEEEKLSGIFKQNSTIHLKSVGFYILTISFENNNSTILSPYIQGEGFFSNLRTDLSPWILYILIIILSALFSIIDSRNYFQDSNSAARISSVLLWTSRFLFKIYEQNALSPISDKDINTHKDAMVSGYDLNVKDFINLCIGEIPFCNLTDKIEKVIPRDKSQDDRNKIQAVYMAISVSELSKRGLEQALKFSPSYLYLILEFMNVNIIKKIYIPRSQEFLIEDSFDILRYSKKELERIDKLIKFDETYIGVFITLVTSILVYLGASIIATNRIPLLFKGGIVFYISLNMFMSILQLISMRTGD